jgi:flagellar biogenesis protein FliO
MQGSPITFIVAFIVVLALIGVAAWLVRRFASSRLGANTQRGRMPRLAVIDAAAVDGRRRLVLVRRDNVEHLLMIGGPTDIVVEPNIVRAAPGRDQLPQRSNAAEPPRIARNEPPLMPRPPRQSEPVKVPPVRVERAAAPPPVPQAPPAPPQAAAAGPSSAEQNLAEMAQRLEAALRRPAGEAVAPPVAPEPPAAPPRAARSEPPAPPAPPTKPAAEKTSFENLEDEMASLLGRPKPSS